MEEKDILPWETLVWVETRSGELPLSTGKEGREGGEKEGKKERRKKEKEERN